LRLTHASDPARKDASGNTAIGLAQQQGNIALIEGK
jgi:hypothetical protein